VTRGKSSSMSGGQSCSGKQQELTLINDEVNSLPAISVLSETRRKPSTNASQPRGTWNEKQTSWLSPDWRRIPGILFSSTRSVVLLKKVGVGSLKPEYVDRWHSNRQCTIRAVD